MADSKLVAVVPLKGTNYPAWKIQIKMALMKEGIVTSEETALTSSNESDWAKFASRQYRTLATIVLAVDTSLLYLISNPEDPTVIWKKLADQFERKHAEADSEILAGGYIHKNHRMW